MKKYRPVTFLVFATLCLLSTVLFIFLKVFSAINWSWWFVFSPLLLLNIISISIMGFVWVVLRRLNLK